MANHEREFDAPHILLVKEVGGQFDFGLLPEDFSRFDSFHMVCAGIVVRGRLTAKTKVAEKRPSLSLCQFQIAGTFEK